MFDGGTEAKPPNDFDLRIGPRVGQIDWKGNKSVDDTEVVAMSK